MSVERSKARGLSQKGVKGFIKTGKYKDLQWYIENDIQKYQEIEELCSKTNESLNSIADKYQLQRTAFREKTKKLGWRKKCKNKEKENEKEPSSIKQEESFEEYIKILDELSLEEKR